MTFEELPANWTTMPLSTPALAADVVDLCLSEADRAQNAMLLLPCDEQDIAWPSPILISDTDWSVAAAERRQNLNTLAELGLPAVVMAVSAPQKIPPETVMAWYRDAQEAFSAAGTRLIGFFSAWPMHVNELTAIT